MRLLLRQRDGSSKEYQFINGPVSIGRATNNQVFLPDRGVSRQHAILHCNDSGKWTVEDKGSSNKTYLNDMAITKAELKHGDCLRIIDFTLEFILEEQAEPEMSNQPEDTLHLEAALTTPKHETVVRKPDAQHAPAMRLAARRLSDFSVASEKIFNTGSLDEMLLTILDIAMDQFSAYHVWSALRTQPGGPMTCHAGKRRDGQPIQLNQLQLNEKIIQAVEKGQFLVLPRVSAQLESKDRIRSAMIATIMRPTGCFGVIYVDNAMINEHYSLSDLDYLMLIAMHSASVLNKFLG